MPAQVYCRTIPSGRHNRQKGPVGCLLLCGLLAVFPIFSSGLLRGQTAVSTFECLSLYWTPETPSDGEAKVRFRAEGEQVWRQGYPVWYDDMDGQFRGSLVNLRSGTTYEIELSAPSGQKAMLTAATRSEQFPIGKTTHLQGGSMDRPVRITESGAAEGWHLVTPSPGTKTVIDVFNLHDHCIEVAADYVIVRGLELKNAGQHAVLIRKGVHNVVVEDCHMTQWGRVGGARVWGVFHGSDSAIYAETGAGGLVLQRNLIEHPRSGANDWESGHPDGPQGISLNNSSGGNIIRYNEIRSTEDHGYNDGIGGSSNFSFEGSPNRDSDIYGNIITHCWDDAIESEGANRNVRLWGNFIDKTFAFVATAGTSKGPLYIYRNVFGTSRISHQDSGGGVIIKTAGVKRTLTLDGREVPGDMGRRYIFHNTTLQPNGALDVFSGHGVCNTITRNNIFRVRGNIYPGRPEKGPPNDFRNDVTGGYLAGGFVRGMFVPSDRLEWFLAATVPSIQWGRVDFSRSGKNFAITDPLVYIANPAIDKGARLPGFNDDYHGDAPDIGAFENGNPPLRFGREAAPGFARAPWETY
ncbi:MAG: right-handed parallel beta-helix repeat-containing protein [Deltaproteobacteria bacterium]|nr:right-handed parallel beta-helix repeat-containing protein [Deltaproteobacteria bacterium]